jgi:hypothetical protein
MTGAVVAIAEAIRRPVVVLMLWIGEATLFAAQHCQMCPRAGLGAARYRRIVLSRCPGDTAATKIDLKLKSPAPRGFSGAWSRKW